MTADSTWAVQTAVYTVLCGNAAVTALLPDRSLGVHDYVPPDAAFPYLVLGETTARPMDTQNSRGYDITLTVHSYSRASGFKELRALMAAVHDILHGAALTPPGQHVTLCDEVSADTRLESDGITRHGLQRFHIVTEPV